MVRGVGGLPPTPLTKKKSPFGDFVLDLADLQSLKNILGLTQKLIQNFVTELAPLGLGDFVVLELAEHDRVLVLHR